jgi:hypothetical protein
MAWAGRASLELLAKYQLHCFKNRAQAPGVEAHTGPHLLEGTRCEMKLALAKVQPLAQSASGAEFHLILAFRTSENHGSAVAKDGQHRIFVYH